ncbi:hypothetical protein M9H77_35669 [Catharanthus roseus]|uniref:Uncharacterized protein n=1 Tax=Catharanthus roseus TaxID=4058 RepID=A0ACB9ZRE0_CATRO|nr:hypothetical protein M9H77_35669 [Catharanthus roseus]
MNSANKLETTNYILKHKSEGCVKRYFRRKKYNKTSYKKPNKYTCWLCKEEGHYANEYPKEKKRSNQNIKKIYEEVLGDAEFEPIKDNSEMEEEESSSDKEIIKETICILRTYTQDEDIRQENIQEIEDDESVVFGNLVYSKLIFTIRPNYAVSLADENLDRCLNLYYQLHRIRMSPGNKAFSIKTKSIYTFCTSHCKEIIKIGQNSNIEIKDEYSYIVEYIPPRQLGENKLIARRNNLRFQQCFL